MDSVFLIPTETEEKRDTQPIETEGFEAPGIQLTGYSLVFFKKIEMILKNKEQIFLSNIFKRFLSSCKQILEICPDISAFDGPWQTEKPNTALDPNTATAVCDPNFLNSARYLYLLNKQSPIEKTKQMLGTFFISSLVKCYEEVILLALFKAKLRIFAENLHKNPLTSNENGITQGITCFENIFKMPHVDITKLLQKFGPKLDLTSSITKEFTSIFHSLASNNPIEFTQLLTLFFLKPFPYEIIQNAECIIQNPDLLIDAITLLNQQLEDQQLNIEPTEKIKKTINELLQEPQQDKLAKNEEYAKHLKNAFQTIKMALSDVKNAMNITIAGETERANQFKEKIQLTVIMEPHSDNSSPDAEYDLPDQKIVKKLNLIFSQYCAAVLLSKKWPALDTFQLLSATESSNAIIISMQGMLNNPGFRSQLRADTHSQRVLASMAHFSTVALSEPQYRITHLKFFKNREAFAALLNANPFIKALLLSQVPTAVILQILRVDNDFQDMSTVIWCEPILALMGFYCGVYALAHPKTLVNKPVRILEALSTSSVVLSKCLGIAILAHTELFPEEGKSGGLDIQEFLKTVASIPISIALLSWLYNSVNPRFKENYFSNRVRFIMDFINHFTIYAGLNQIISISIIKIINNIQKVDFSSRSNKILLETLPMLPAIFSAYARIKPIHTCKRGHANINISESINTATLYTFATAFLTNLVINLSLADNSLQANFRRVFFPLLFSGAIVMMHRFKNDFSKMYTNNPEIIIYPIQPNEIQEDDNSLIINATEFQELQELKEGYQKIDEEGSRTNNPLIFHKLFNKQADQKNTNINSRRQMRCPPCAIL